MPHRLGTDPGERRAADIHEALEILGERIYGFQSAVERVRQDLRPVLLDFAGYDRDGFFNQLLDVRFLLAQHVYGPARVESPHDDIDPGGPELSAQIKGPRKLIGLDPH